jgi:hypothetical protein
MMMKRSLLLAGCAALSLSGIGLPIAPSHAETLYGSTVWDFAYFPDHSSAYASASATVGPGVEFPLGALGDGTQNMMDVGPSSITFTTLDASTYTAYPFNGYELDFALAPDIVDAWVDPMSSFTVPIGFNSVGVWFNLSGVTGDKGEKLIIDLAFASSDPNNPGSTVPEPSTWAMMLLGFAGLGFATMRRSQRLRAIV